MAFIAGKTRIYKWGGATLWTITVTLVIKFRTMFVLHFSEFS